MNITVLGSGTSHGIPVIGCRCRVCLSTYTKNRRTRSSIWVTEDNASIIFDTTTDFRQQALREDIRSIDAVFLTHAHADHIHGLDDIRPLTYEHVVPIYGNRSTIEEINSRFSYIFTKTQKGGGKPRTSLWTINTEEVHIGPLTVVAIPIKHGSLDVFGYRINNFAYCTDCSRIPAASYPLLEGLEVLVIGALRYTHHATHFSIAEAVEVIRNVKPKKAYLTHLCHDVEHRQLSAQLPPGIEPAWDGLTITI